MGYKFFGKSLYIEEGGRKILAISDLHLGYEEGAREAGLFMITALFEETKLELERIFSLVGLVNEIVILGDLKHIFGKILHSEWEEVAQLSALLRKYCKKIILVKGNHDATVARLARKNDFYLCDYYLTGSCAFLHGDKDFEAIYDKNVKLWVVGHAHPAITLRDRFKEEKYKCFLGGTYKRREIIIVPSWFSARAGVDVRNSDLRIAWPINTQKTRVYVVEDGLDVLDFGLLRDIP